MGTPHPNSPNGCWRRHGYRSERTGKYGSARNVYAPDGTLVLASAGVLTQRFLHRSGR